MRRAIVLFAAVLATCVMTSSWAQDFVSNLPAGEIAPFGKDAYQVREPPPLDVADRLAKQKASDYCKKMNKTMVVKDATTFSLGSGLYLVFSCVSSVQDAVNR